jgi:hypothetical protein
MKFKTYILLLCLAFVFACKKSSVISNNYSPSLAGTKWRIYQYKDATTTTPQTRSDTLYFLDGTQYKYNNQTFTYYLNYSSVLHLGLNGTPFGDLDGVVPSNFISNEEIIGVPFNRIYGTYQTYYLWMKKL